MNKRSTVFVRYQFNSIHFHGRYGAACAPTVIAMSNTSLIIKSIFELAAACFVAWGLFNESKLVRFERRVARIVKLYIRDYRKEKSLAAELQACSSRSPSPAQAQYARHRRTSMPADSTISRRNGNGGGKPQHPRKVA